MEPTLGLARRLRRALIQRGHLTREEAGQIAASPEHTWEELSGRDRERWMSWASEAVRWLVRDLPFPAQEGPEGWETISPGTPIHCATCGQLLGWATPERTLRLSFTDPAVEIKDGHVRCVCGEERAWVRYNGACEPDPPPSMPVHEQAC